ncbi:hypothetical protein OZ410_08670 [Robiginitalea sp. M366]|uniref:hypothetical protein n=1 Tax=Robiginitalea aestuariiviva TaxID=3036903 RepID=UPI00240D62CB|nr:hypothetical protein [Robiginitalea aestuariiviva]MDG1572387.1 hypothetical protein [Robiginitalea aestuariiviva]
MSQNLKELFERERERDFPMPPGHEQRFAARLETELPARRPRTYLWVSMAACVVGLLGLGLWFYRPAPDIGGGAAEVVVQDSTANGKGLSLGDLSPDLRKVEQYYAAQIGMELATLDISDSYKAVADDYLGRLRELDAAYQDLSRELNEVGPNEETITAMIRNFQLRLDLLLKLKAKLNELKTSKNETVTGSSA